ncbi:hypothetical protein AU196_22050 [Mycobacterium sp. IS-1742]|nr:hypothetical protein AU196_22050 [Mycobacterium sp. IS-1742]
MAARLPRALWAAWPRRPSRCRPPRRSLPRATPPASQPAGEGEASVRAYFTAHPNEFVDLRNIARPLIDQRNQCGVTVQPGQLATLFDALAE